MNGEISKKSTTPSRLTSPSNTGGSQVPPLRSRQIAHKTACRQSPDRRSIYKYAEPRWLRDSRFWFFFAFPKNDFGEIVFGLGSVGAATSFDVRLQLV